MPKFKVGDIIREKFNHSYGEPVEVLRIDNSLYILKLRYYQKCIHISDADMNFELIPGANTPLWRTLNVS